MAYNNWPEVARNLAKARAAWNRLTSILNREVGGAAGVRMFP